MKIGLKRDILGSFTFQLKLMNFSCPLIKWGENNNNKNYNKITDKELQQAVE